MLSHNDHPGVIWRIGNKKTSIKQLFVHTYNERIYKINVQFADGSDTNYKTVRNLLEQKYGGGVTNTLFGISRFIPTVDGSQLIITLNHDMGFIEDDTLELHYALLALQEDLQKEQQRTNAINRNKELEMQKRKAAKINQDL